MPWRALGAFLLSLAIARGAGAQLVLNELLANNGLSGVDEDGDNEDWLELYNTGDQTMLLAGYTLTDDPLIPDKWTFPEVWVAAHDFLRVWISGKDRFLPPPESITGSANGYPFEPTLIPADADWRLLVPPPGALHGPQAGWKNFGFDDSGWETGKPGFGYGDDDDYTELPPGTSAIFIRKKFWVDDPTKLESLVLQVDYDDGFVAYLNGVQAAARNFDGGTVTYSSVATASHEHGTPERFDLMPFRDKLVAGENVLAIAGLNVSNTSTDLSLLPELGTIPLILHSSFKLDNDGEYLGLRDAAGVLVDEIEFGEQTQDHSYGRAPDGAGPWLYLLSPTPEALNATFTSPTPISSRVLTDPLPGKYPSAIDVQFAVEPKEVAVVRYTTDGTAPSPTSTAYQGPIRVSKSTVFRVAGFIGAERSTQIVSRSYFLGGTLSLPILSISMDPADYVTVHNDAGASGRSSERGCYMEIFTEDGEPGPATGCGLRLHGGAGRGGDMNTKKAYKCYFRRMYGDERLRYPLIPDTTVDDFDKLVLRSGFNDAFRTNGAAAYLRDELIRQLHGDMGGLYSHGTWYNLYVNMRYRGVYNVVERMDEEFLQSYTGEKKWDVIKTGNDVLVGENTEWERLHNFVTQNDLSIDNLYDQAANLVDLPNFTSYMIVNTWAQNHDWPHNNWYAARPQAADGKWIFLCWDAEFGIGLIPGGYGADSFHFSLDQGSYIGDLLRGLLGNARYREYFVEEVDRHLFDALRASNVLARIEALRKIIAPDMPEEAQLTGNNYSQWLNNVATCQSFAQNRSTPYRNFILNSTRFDFPAPPRVFASNPGRAVNTGGTVVRLRGVRFRGDTRFLFNGVPAAAARLVSNPSEANMDVTLPLDLRISGFPAITAEDPRNGERSESRGALEVLPPVPDVTAIEPGTGSASGGDRVSITGQYFLEGVTVKFGSAAATDVTRVDGGMTVLEATVPAGQGEVEVTVSNHINGEEVPARNRMRYVYQGGAPRFHRGDSNGDGLLDISDGVLILGFLYLGADGPDCEDAADVNDSGEIDISDAIYGLAFLFTGGESPPEPHLTCGQDPTEDPVPCGNEGSCR